MPIAKGTLLSQNPPAEIFMKEFAEIGASGISKKYGVNERHVYARRRMIEQSTGTVMKPPTRGGHHQQLDRHPASAAVSIMDGTILIGSDSHYLPGTVTTAHRAFVEFAKEFKPKVIIKNGDELDFPGISRHGMIGWENRPTVISEIENAKAMLSEIEKASPKSRRIWPLGNHDSRFETRLASVAPEYAQVHGVHLKDSFPKWEGCWAAFVNNDVVVKHRFKSGMHAPHNNTMWAGRSICTGHLHSLKVMPISDYNGTRYGVDCGTLADPYGPQFYNYTEINPVNWRSGFVLLTFVKGRLLWPEVVFVSGPDRVEFRGKEYNV
jgi:hypothetical protein